MPSTATAAKTSSPLVGQDQFFNTVNPYINIADAGLAPDNRPAGVFYLLGPTGTGKTYAVETISKQIHQTAAPQVLRIDCGEYQLAHEVAKLIGAPPGYLGHRETPPLLSQMKVNQVKSDRNNLSVILFDEIEKAHESFYRILLGIMDRGVANLGDNTKVSFDKSLIFFTSNVGAVESARRSVGYGEAEATADDKYRAAVYDHFPREFIGRIDEFIVFNLLTPGDYREIFRLEVKKIQNLLAQRCIGTVTLDVSDTVTEAIVDNLRGNRSGAREMRKLVNRHIFFPIGELLTREKRVSDTNQKITVSLKNKNLNLGDIKVSL